MAKKNDFVLTDSNYYSADANKRFCSVSQLKSFIGTPAQLGCEYKAMEELNGRYIRPETDALLVGSYVDTALLEPEKMESFKELHPEMISTRGKTAGQVKAEFMVADRMIEKVKNDKKCMALLDGEHQTVMTGEIFGLPFKIKMDNYRPGKFIADLKTCEDIYKSYYAKGYGTMSFIEYFDYILQGAIYQEIVRQNTGQKLPFYIVAVSKQKDEPDLQAIWIDNESLKRKLFGDELAPGLADEITRVRMIKNGEIEPCRCGKCLLCRQTKVIDKIIDWRELLGEV